jgi:hypothetical protein
VQINIWLRVARLPARLRDRVTEHEKFNITADYYFIATGVRCKATPPKPRRHIAAYQDFLTLWKDGDPDIPILKQAKAEYAKLK